MKLVCIMKFVLKLVLCGDFQLSAWNIPAAPQLPPVSGATTIPVDTSAHLCLSEYLKPPTLAPLVNYLL